MNLPEPPRSESLGVSPLLLRNWRTPALRSHSEEKAKDTGPQGAGAGRGARSQAGPTRPVLCGSGAGGTRLPALPSGPPGPARPPPLPQGGKLPNSWPSESVPSTKEVQ